MSLFDMRLVSATEYYAALLQRIPTAKNRIVIHAMTILWSETTEKIFTELLAALERGVEVRIVGDIYSKFYANTPKLIRARDHHKWAYTRALNTRLEAEGAHVKYIGKLGINPFKGRTHSKITLIDNVAYTFGGVNFTNGSFHNHDYMLQITNSEICDELYRLIMAIEQAKQPMADIIKAISPTATMLFDGGSPGTSAIYDKACEVVAQARKVYYVSQMCPSGKLAKLITATENECYFIRYSQADPLANLALVVDQKRYGITNSYTGKQYIHAKFILCEGKDGSRHIISGSNNFSWRGIAYGTKEIAVHSTDPNLWATFYNYMQREIISETKTNKA
ncbi:MAG TPA: phospholipase D-like domain-containing protein [Candidatus Saccharimonadales bacterium]